MHAPTPERPLYAILPTDGEPILLAPAIEFEHAKSKSWFKDIRQWYHDLPSREQPFKSLAKLLNDIGIANQNIGVEDTAAIAALQKEMPTTTFVNARDVVRDLRMIKSNEELDLMRGCAKYADYALQVVKESVREGVTELELVGEAVQETLSKMMKEVKEIDGPMPINVRVITGPATAFPHAFSTTRKVKKGDLVSPYALASAYGYGGGEIQRTLFYGKPTKEQKKIYGIALKANSLAMAAMKPGVVCSEVHKVSHDYFMSSGYGKYVLTKIGQLRGLESRDDITLTETDQTVLKPGMTFWVGSAICIPDNGGYRVGHLVLVTEKGSESMQEFPSEIESLIIGS